MNTVSLQKQTILKLTTYCKADYFLSRAFKLKGLIREQPLTVISLPKHYLLNLLNDEM